jgi:hypothetical protein
MVRIKRQDLCSSETVRTCIFGGPLKHHLLTLAIIFLSLGSPSLHAEGTKREKSYDYMRMFELSRQLLIEHPPAEKFLRDVFEEALVLPPDAAQIKEGDSDKPQFLKRFPEAMLIALLQHFPQYWDDVEKYLKAIPQIDEDNEHQKELRAKFREKFKEMFEEKEVLEKLLKITDIDEPYELETKDGSPAIPKRVVHFSVPSYFKMRIVPASNLESVWIELAGGAKKEYGINSFEFNLPNLVDKIIEVQEAGKVRGIIGMDINMIFPKEGEEPTPGMLETQEILKRFEKAGFKIVKAEDLRAGKEKIEDGKSYIVLVKPTGLNHQKQGYRDPTDPENVMVVQASGNLTKSCSGGCGDFTGHEKVIKPRDLKSWGKPNVNDMVVTYGSTIHAALVHNDITKTLVYGLRLGKEYPLNGAYRLSSVNGARGTFTWTPNGARGNVIDDMHVKMIKKVITQMKSGDLPMTTPMAMVAFAFSSVPLEDAIFEFLSFQIEKTGDFDFEGLFDRTNATADWSIVLKMIGFKKNDDKSFSEDKEGRWYKLLTSNGKTDLVEKMRKVIKVSPKWWQTGVTVTGTDGKPYTSNRKYHNKGLTVGPYSSNGSSFNQSDAAESNTEQAMIWMDPEIAERDRGLIAYSIKDPNVKTLYETVLKSIEGKKRAASGVSKKKKEPSEKTVKEKPKTKPSTRKLMGAAADCAVDLDNVG